MQDLPKRDAVVDVYILVARSTDIGAHIATRGRILFVQVHFLTALRAARRIFHGRFSIAANSRSIFSAFARSAGCSLANPPAARTFSNMRSFSAADPLQIAHPAERDALSLGLLPLPEHAPPSKPRTATLRKIASVYSLDGDRLQVNVFKAPYIDGPNIW